jgi:hypothetical protein
MDTTNDANAANTPHVGNMYTGVKYIPITSIVRYIRIYNLPTTLSDSTELATVKVYFNQSSTPAMTKTITAKEASRGYVDLHISKPYISAVQLEVEWNTSVTMGDNVYAPSYAIVGVEKTTTKSPDNN